MSIINHTFKKKAAAIVVASVLGLSSTLLADTGGLKVMVTDASGEPVANATVFVSTPESLIKKSVTTNADGFVRISGLDPSNKYTISISGSGFDEFSANNIKVVSGKSFGLNYVLPSDQSETITITGSRNQAQIDTTSSIVGVDLTLELLESLPTQRTYQSYLQLAPGTKPSLTGNPSSRSGVNYSDIGGAVGTSSDNVYYLDGINTTDNSTGTFGANINSEIIQEQQVITGGIPAEYEGGSGLVTRVVTKSGGNEFSGSVNYYFQNDSLVADNDNLTANSFSTYDTAFTLGGPIIKDSLWFFASYQNKYREDDVTDIDTGDILRTVTDEADLGFLKLTWQPTYNDNVTLSYFNDPRTISGSSASTTLNNRDTAREQGGDKYKFEYSHSWDDLIVTFMAASHVGEVSSVAADRSTRNDLAYMNYSPSLAELNKGGRGSDFISSRDKQELKLNIEYFLDTDFGTHAIKAGISKTTNDNNQNSVYTGDGAQYTSIGNMNAGTTVDQYTGGGWTGTVDLSGDDYARVITAMEDSGNYSYYLGLLDTDGSGSISSAEFGTLAFNSTAGNPTGDVNVYRINMTQTAPVTMQSKGTTFYVQDAWTIDQLTINAGLRAEKWEHFASTGQKIAVFDWDIAPRLSAIYDIQGDGTQKVWGFFGRYYDPVRTNMTDFAGNLTGPIREEQLYVGDNWLTYRTRGGTSTQDAFFAPTTKTPYTDEFVLGYSQLIGDDMSMSVTYTDRTTEDILEDYDLHLYVDVLAGTDYHLPYSYFGYTENPGSNYVIATLEGGKRVYKGMEFTVTKHRADNWMMSASYTYNDAEGNTNSDSNADFQGDVVWLDPRSPNQYGKQPGNISHLVKVFGTYYFDNGIEVGAVYNWNSGTRYSETWSIYGRHLPNMDWANEYDSGGLVGPWLDPNAVGSHETPSYGTLDLRVKYKIDFADGYEAEVFLDIFNLLDDQAVRREQDVTAGDGIYAFGEGNAWVSPRRFYLGARVSF